jgi:hypothetical protein
LREGDDRHTKDMPTMRLIRQPLFH